MTRPTPPDISGVRDWSDARRGLFSTRPIKKQLTLRNIDADVIAWFKSRTPKGQV